MCRACWVFMVAPACFHGELHWVVGLTLHPTPLSPGGCTRASLKQGSYVVPACGFLSAGAPQQDIRMHQRRNACAGADVCSEHAELYHYAVLQGLVLYWLLEKQTVCSAMLSIYCWRSRHRARASRHRLGGVSMRQGNILEY